MNLLVTGAWQCTKEQLNELQSRGHTVVFMQYEKDALPCEYSWVEGTICNGLFLSHPIERFTSLKFIQITSAGFDRVPMDYIRKHNIEIHNAKGVYSIPMAEFAVGGVLALYKKLDTFKEQQKNRQWIKHRDLLELHGKTVCIVGCGDVGQECAKRFAAFGCCVLGVNRTIKELPNFDRILPFDMLAEVLSQSDVVVLTIALTDETQHLMGKEQLAVLKSGAVLCNISRGAVVDTAALLEWLHSEISGGAVLDVFEEEPLDYDSELWNEEKVIVSPHTSFSSDRNRYRLNSIIAFNLEQQK